MKKSLYVAAFAVSSFIALPAFADTIAISSIPVNGNAGTNGYHTISIDKASCKVKNSAMVGAQQGCNYNISLSGINADGTGGTWTVVPQQQNNCSTKCE